MCHRRFAAIVAAIMAFAAWIAAARVAESGTLSTWNGSSGNWTDTARWSTNPFYPNNGNGAASYNAVINGGTVNLNTDVALSSLSLNGGTLNGAGNLSADILTIKGGTLSTAGTITSTQIALTSGTLGRNLTLPTTASNTIGNAAIPSGVTLTNPVGATLTATTSPGDAESFGSGLLLNQGTFIKSGTGRFYASLPMNNTGDVQVQQGNLRLNNTGTQSGTFEVSSGAQLETTSAQTFQASSTVSGLGGLAILSNTATLNGEASAGYVWLNGGTLAGSGNLHPEHFTFDAGTLARDLTLPASANNTIGNLTIGSGFTLTNPVGSTLSAIASPGDRESLGPGTLLNQGTFIKSGTGRFYASLPMNNVGDVQVQQGNLRLNSTGTHTGTFEVSAPAQLELSGTQTLQPGATVSGAGGLRILGGTATINSDVSAGFLWLSSGTLAGSGNLNPGHFTFDGGTLARDLTINASSSNTITSLGIANGFTLTNPSVGQLGTSSGTVSGPGSFVNQGTITKTGGSTETFATFSNKPSGAVNVQAGTLALSGVGTQEGTFTVSSGATLAFGGQSTSNTTLTTDTLISGAGKVNVAQGTLNVPGGSSNDYAGGTTVGSGGRVNITGAGTGLSPATATIQSGGVVSIEAASNLLSSQALVQSGGTLAVRNDFTPQSQIAASSSGTFGIDFLGFASTVDMLALGNGSMSLGSSTAGSYTASSLGPGAGNTYRLGGGGGTITLTQPGVLTGDRPLVIVGPGTVVLPQAQNFTQGTTVQSGTLALGDTGSLGSGPVTFQGGGLQASGPLTLHNDITLAGNITIGGSSDLTLAGTEKLTGNRTVTVSNTGTTTISGNITQDVSGRGLTKDGPGVLILSGSSSFTGGLDVRAGTVTFAAAQNYGGFTGVESGGTLNLQADLLGSSSGVFVLGGGTLMGNGHVAGAATIVSTATLSPGHSPGVLDFTSGLALQSGSHFKWELDAFTTAGPGSDWDQVGITGGQLSISSGAILNPTFISSATSPAADDAFWNSSHRWSHIIDLSGSATNPTGFVNFTINNSQWAQFGAFTTIASSSGLGVDLMWTAAPEPASWVLWILGFSLLWLLRRAHGIA